MVVLIDAMQFELFYQFGCDSINRIKACNHYAARLLGFTISFIPTKIPTIRQDLRVTGFFI